MAWHGIGDMLDCGEEGFRFQTKLKSFMLRWPDTIAKSPEFAMPVAR